GIIFYVFSSACTLVRLRFGSDGVSRLKCNLIRRWRWSGDGCGRCAGVKKASTIFAMRRLSVVVENLLKSRGWVRPPSDWPATQCNGINKITVRKLSYGRLGQGPRGADQFAANPLDHLRSFGHTTSLPESQPRRVACERLSQRTRTDSVARVIPV